MALQNVSATGGFSGRLGQLVGYQWNGRWCLRLRPAAVRNPRTAAQQAARSRFAGAVQQAAKMRWGVMEGLRGVAREAGMTPYNAFVSLNQQAFSMVDGVFTVDYAALRISTGPVAPVAVTQAAVDAHNVLTVRFERNPLNMRAGSFDAVNVYVYCPAIEDEYLAAAVYRRDGRVAVALPDTFAGQPMHIYAYVTDQAGLTSETAYASVNMGDGEVVAVPEEATCPTMHSPSVSAALGSEDITRKGVTKTSGDHHIP